MYYNMLYCTGTIECCCEAVANNIISRVVPTHVTYKLRYKSLLFLWILCCPRKLVLASSAVNTLRVKLFWLKLFNDYAGTRLAF